MNYITKSYEETVNVAIEFSSRLSPGDIITLDGDLGAGKTAFTSGMAKAFGCEDPVTSPTFTIVNEYRKSNVPIFHFDIYRLTSMDDLYDIGWEDYVNQNGVIIMEWASIVKHEFDFPYYEVIINKRFDIGEDAREIIISYRSEC